MIALAPLTVQCIPARLSRVPITTSHPASTTPVEVHSPSLLRQTRTRLAVYATFLFASDQQVGETILMERQSFRFVKDAKLWYAEPGSSNPTATSQARTENVIVLSEEFWKEIQEHPIPVDLTVVKALADSLGNWTSTSGSSGAAGQPNVRLPCRCLA